MGSKSARRATGMSARAVGRSAGMGARATGKSVGRGAGRGSEAASMIVNSINAPIGTQTSQDSQYTAW